MGTLQLLKIAALLALCAFAGCVEREPRAAHAKLACSACHAGAIADSGVAAVPNESCTASGCHDNHGPAEVQMGAIAFKHRDHGKSNVSLGTSCAGCHGHAVDAVKLPASLEACILCHRGDVFEPATRNCALCHGNLGHEGTTDQNVHVAHAWLEPTPELCARCHYDVGSTTLEHSVERCTACHASSAAVLTAGAGVDLHPSHRGFACQRCHGPTDHRIRARSSAVQLDCHGCHDGIHPDDDSIAPGMSSQECSSCHDGVHAAQQQMVLGVIESESRVQLGRKFLAGLTCHSCHQPDGQRPSAATCTGCHEEGYAQILPWWKDGVQQRLALVRADLAEANGVLAGAGTDSTATFLSHADELLRLLEQGGGHHNIELADWLLRRSRLSIDDAYRVAGHPVPEFADLGPKPRDGYCSFCHYAWSAGESLEQPNTATHRRYLEPK